MTCVISFNGAMTFQSWIQPIRWIGLLQGERRRLGGVGRAVCLCGVRMGDGGRA